MATKLSSDYEEYAMKTIADSTLMVWYTYTGKEKSEIRMDTTIVKGKTFRVVTTIPTVQYQWTHKTPDFKGFQEYLKIKK